MTARVAPFGRLPGGRTIERFTIASGAIEADVIPFGATLVAIRVPDLRGRPGDVVLGFDSIEPYLGPCGYMGAVVGRSANRIAQGRAVVAGREVRLTPNEPPHHLHGGAAGFDKKLWRVDGTTPSSVRFSLTSPDGDEGYPGRLEIRVTYEAIPGSGLRFDHEATCDRPTIVNPAQHAYFHLGDGGATVVASHVLSIRSSLMTPADEAGIPTGEIASVEGTPYDFRTPAVLGPRIAAIGGGFDRNFVVADGESGGLLPAARLEDHSAGRRLEILTTRPGLQLYTAGRFDGSLVGRGGARYRAFHGVALEAQGFPDAPNHDRFPRTTIAAGETASGSTVYRFSSG